MKITYQQVFLAAAGLLISLVDVVAAASGPTEEDAVFWDRFLGNTDLMINNNAHRAEMSLTPPPSPPPTPPPTPKVTSSPTDPPSPGPTPPPSLIPTIPPTPSPTPEPTPEPTPGPTPLLFPPPTPTPTYSPTPSPTTSFPTNPPTPGPCIMNVTVYCKLENGLACDEKNSPDGTCAIGTGISVLAFSYQPERDCTDSNNMQGGIAVCTDLAPLGNGPASVTCIDLASSSMLTIEPAVVDPDQIFTVKHSSGGGKLPTTIECTLTSTASGSTVQVNVIDVSGDVTLNLKDKFGAMQLETCDEQVCIELGCFEYAFENAGTGDMKVINVERTINGGSLLQLVDQVSPNPVARGEVVVIEEKIPIDYCQVSAVEVVKIYAEAENVIGSINFDEDEYIVPINWTPPPPAPSPMPVPTPPAPVTPIMPTPTSPSAPQGPTPIMPPTLPPLPSSAFPLPTTTLPPLPMPSVSGTAPPAEMMCTIDIVASCDNCDFNTSTLPECAASPTMFGILFRGGNCDESSFSQPVENVTCADFNGGPPTMGTNTTAYIEYTGTTDTSETPIFAGTVREGDVFYIYNGGEQLDANLNFNIWSDSSKGTLLQSVFFHASCSQPLALKDVFGATQIVQYANSLQGIISCFISIEVSYTISVPDNLPAGEDSLIMSGISIRTNYTDPEVIDFTDLVNGVVIGPGNPPIEVAIEATLNLAIPQAYETTVIASGETAISGQNCSGVDYSVFFAPINEAPPGWTPPVPTAPAPLPTAVLPTVPAPTATIPTATLPPAVFPTVPAPTAPLPTEPAPTGTIPTATLPPAVFPTVPAPTAPLPTAVFPTVPAPTAPLPTVPLPTVAAPTVPMPILPVPAPTLPVPTVSAPATPSSKSKKKSMKEP